jgi:cytochrome c5
VSHADNIFVRNFLALLGALVAFVIFAIFLGKTIGDRTWERMQGASESVQQRITPVASVRVGEAGKQAPAPQQGGTQVAAAAQSASAQQGGKSGEEVYKSVCSACHASGVAGAPKVGDNAAWEPRAKQGMDTLLSHAVNGFKAMPPKGGDPSLTDTEVKRDIEYMLSQSGVQLPGTAAAGASGQAASDASGGTSAPATASSGGDPEAGKKVYESTCHVCHGTGVAGAPKLGDKAAWEPRAEQGMGTLVNHAVNGFKAMPPKGGNMSLNESDIHNAIAYMLKQAGVDAK